MPVLRQDPVFLQKAVESVLAQSFSQWELVVVEDPSEQTAEDYFRQLNDPRIRYHLNSQRTSLVSQRNLGLQLAQAELVAMLDSDDECHPHRLQRQYEYLRDHAEIGIVGSQLAIIDGQGQVFAQRKYPQQHEEIIQAMQCYSPLAQPAVMFRKAIVEEAGGYQYCDYLGVEDYELWCRLAQRKVRFANLPEELLRYRVQPKQLKAGNVRQQLRGTLEIKRRYLKGRWNLRSRLRWWCERGLLLLPPKWVLKLFVRMTYKS